MKLWDGTSCLLYSDNLKKLASARENCIFKIFYILKEVECTLNFNFVYLGGKVHSWKYNSRGNHV